MAQEKFLISSVGELIEQGYYHCVNEHFAEAITYFKRVIELDKNHEEAHAYLAFCYLILGTDLKEHSQHIKERTVIALFELHAETCTLLDVNGQENRLEIISQLNKLTKIESDLDKEPIGVSLLLKTRILLIKTLLASKIGEFGSAFAILEKLKSHHPTIFKQSCEAQAGIVWVALFLIQEQWQDLLNQLKCLLQKQYTERNKDIVTCYVESIFSTLLKTPDCKYAIYAFLLSLCADNTPAFSLFWYLYFEEKLKMGKRFECLQQMTELNLLYEETVPCLDRALAIYPQCLEFYRLKGDFLFLLSRYPEAEVLFWQAIQMYHDPLWEKIYPYVYESEKVILNIFHTSHQFANDAKQFTKRDLYDEACIWLSIQGDQEEPPEHLKEIIAIAKTIDDLHKQRQEAWQKEVNRPSGRVATYNQLTKGPINKSWRNLKLPEYQEPLLSLPSLFSLSLFCVKKKQLNTAPLNEDIQLKIAKMDDRSIYTIVTS